MKKQILMFLALTSSLSAIAQVIWTADIKAVEESGYYNIELDQSLIGAAKNDFSDLRVLTLENRKSIETPFFMRPVSPIQEASSFETYLLKENIVKDSLNIVTVDNSTRENLDSFYLLINNAEVKIEMSIRGSNDLKQWYIVKQKSPVSNYRNNQGNNAMLLLDFPQGNYKYYEISLSNDQSSPLEIQRVGKMNSASIYGQFTEVAIGKPLQKEEDNITHISFTNIQDTYRISKLEFSINTKMAFLRNAQLSDSLHKNHASFQLSSKGENVFFIDNFRLQASSSIRINNHNNPALAIDSIKAFALKRYICAYLEKDKKYTLKLDAKAYTTPNYDIEHFKNDIAVDLPVVATANISTAEQPKPILEVREQMLIEKPIVLWSVLISIGLFLSFICVRMIKQMKKEEK